jgi:hypothetical protein
VTVNEQRQLVLERVAVRQHAGGEKSKYLLHVDALASLSASRLGNRKENEPAARVVGGHFVDEVSVDASCDIGSHLERRHDA